MLSNLDYDCAPPRNINDLELHAEMEELPQSRQVTVFTDTSFLHLSMQSFQLRTKLCSLMNSLRGTPDFSDILQHDSQIQRYLALIPQWPDARSTQARMILDLQLRQFLVVLHAPRALQVDQHADSSRRYSTITALEAAATTIDLHIKALKTSNALCLTRNDYFRASLLICHITYHATQAKG
jgi:hypothetical protein